ncbi:hypothetical protein [Tautonia plasticadhaerens]|uniref:Uncharacterized protein n=1 Tax=Tautonia plasticadhaerens TaxID=2527974 RepID=A0A518H2A9_9BACT|nr:hypothetical protein [Tautonia plasticadhaerens]QDV34963.1 hypothetical protein ElP_28600 [Tautonia plasticadhaerens]
MTQKHLFFTDPLTAAWAAKHCNLTVILRATAAGDYDAYGTRNAHHLVDDWDYRNRPGSKLHPVSRVYIHPDSILTLEALPEAKKAALRELGMWPESEAA